MAQSKYHWKSAGEAGIAWDTDLSEDVAIARINYTGHRWHWHVAVGHQVVERGSHEDFSQAVADAEKEIEERIAPNETLYQNVACAKKTIREFLAAQNQKKA